MITNNLMVHTLNYISCKLLKDDDIMMLLVVGFGPYLQMHLLIMVLIVMLQRVQISSKYYLVYVLLFWHLKAPQKRICSSNNCECTNRHKVIVNEQCYYLYVQCNKILKLPLHKNMEKIHEELNNMAYIYIQQKSIQLCFLESYNHLPFLLGLLGKMRSTMLYRTQLSDTCTHVCLIKRWKKS